MGGGAGGKGKGRGGGKGAGERVQGGGVVEVEEVRCVDVFMLVCV